MADVLLIGGGAHCAVVIEAMLLGGEHTPAGVVVAPGAPASDVAGCPVAGTDDDLAALRSRASLAFVTVGAVSVGDARERLFEAAAAAGYSFPAVVHPAASVSPSAEIGEGTFVAAGAVVGTGARIGRDCIINSGAVVDHDCVIGDHAHVAPGAALSGGCTVGERSLVGVGASVVQGVRIGADTVIGAGAAVTEDVPDGVVAVGVPCRVVRSD